MQVAAFYTSAITGTEIENVLSIENGTVEWRNVESGRRILNSPTWRAADLKSHDLDSLDWFERVYSDMKPRFALR